MTRRLLVVALVCALWQGVEAYYGSYEQHLAYEQYLAQVQAAASFLEQDFSLLEDLSARSGVRVAHKERVKATVGEGEGNFPAQSWTYGDLENPPEWLVPKEMQPPGLPTTKPPPVPEMPPPPPPFADSLDSHGPYSSAGAESPSPPTYTLPRPPPAALPRWIPWSAYYVPTKKT